MEKKRRVKRHIFDYALITAGSMIYALAFNIFMKAYDINPGGVTGIAMVINYLAKFLPVGVLIIAMNLPLFFISFRKFGGHFVVKTIYGTVISSIFIDFSAGIPYFYTEPLLAAVYGGVLIGLGLGLVFAGNATTGGTETLAMLIKTGFRHIPVGRILLSVDLVVIVLSAAVFNNINSALYSIITLYISAKMIDTILYGMDFGKVAYIISDTPDEISKALRDKLGRGATYLYGEGSYTGQRKKVILVAIKRRQIVELKELVGEVDSRAFIILTEAHEILGEGFGEYDKNKTV